MHNEIPPPNAFHHPLVRDLCWTLSPEYDLLADLPPYARFSPPQSPAEIGSWLHTLEADSQRLEAFMSEPCHQRLGRHFERLILFYFRNSPANPFRVREHNRPIMGQSPDGRRFTLGELDFLLDGPTGVLHLETAVKFYLGFAHAGQVEWLGPGLQDRLSRKLRHLREHQLPLSKNLQVEQMERRFWLKGVLFHPWPHTLGLPPGVVQPAEASFWLTCSQALDVLVKSAGWTCLPRARWLGGAREEAAASENRIREHFTAPGKALMLWNDDLGARALVVADDWPAAAQSAFAEA